MRWENASFMALFGVMACADPAAVNPAPLPMQDASVEPDAAAEAGQDAIAPDAQPPKQAGVVRRTVMQRSPFGNLEQTGNLLMDGDFELSSGYEQSPWVALDAVGQVPLLKATGGFCRSGLSCLVLDHQTNSAYGRGVTSEAGDLEFWMWVHVPGDDCNVVWMALIRDMLKTITNLEVVHPESDAPDESGWCRFHHFKTQEKEAVGVYVEADLAEGERVILDDAVLRPADGLAPMQWSGKQIPPARRERASRRLAELSRRRFVGVPGPWSPSMPLVPAPPPALEP